MSCPRYSKQKFRTTGKGQYQLFSLSPGDWLVSGAYRPLNTLIPKILDLSDRFAKERSFTGW